MLNKKALHNELLCGRLPVPIYRKGARTTDSPDEKSGCSESVDVLFFSN